MSRNKYWDEDSDYVKGRRFERDPLDKYKHRIYDYNDDDFDIDEEGYLPVDDDEYEEDTW